ncbi:hypothetical protein F511_44647 [Dorcoceras hygrometricum]|uniref:Transposase (Putative), gypsy type n=1 Tax=Dorcoceras hygrometricum TaxID=472368 RepID=A0A2Z6ZXH8_9LAMI|nr:hypothetical protein F511_44647 [Dorcoceras hygrometricum]
MFDKFELVIPGLEERAHLPPRGFHTFYINQLEMGLRFLLPRFIAPLCHHIKISPSQLAPNTYSFLLALAVLLRYYNIPLIPYVLMQLVQVKRLGPGKFYLSHKGDHAFIKGNPSSHKGWMSRFFFVKRVRKKRDPWRYEMSWRDNMYTFTPRTPERSPNLATFLADMREMHFNAPELIKEDLLCFFGFSRKGVELVGDLDERMGKAVMLKAMEEAEAASSGATAPPTKATKKRKASSPTKKEARRQRKKNGASTSEARPVPIDEKSRAPTPPIPTTEERPDPMHVITIPEASSPNGGPTKEPGPGRVPPLNFFEDSLVVSPSGVVATNLLCHIAPDRDIGRLSGAGNAEAMSLFSSNLAAREAGDLHRSFDDTAEHCTELETRLVEVEAARAEEARATEMHRAALETRGLRLEVERVALLSENKALAVEKVAMRADLADTKARDEEEARLLRSEAIHAWDLGKEGFLQSSEFDTLCAKKAVAYFRVGFEDCVAQFQANGYSEEEHPASFLDMKKALMEMPDDEEPEEEDEEEEEEDTTPGDGATPPSSPK